MTADERIASLEALVAQQQEQIAQQREQIAQLSADVRELEGRLAKDRDNSWRGWGSSPGWDGADGHRGIEVRGARTFARLGGAPTVWPLSHGR